MKHRPYQRDSDVELLQAFNSAAIAETDHCGYLHPGDIPHHIFSGNRHYDPSDILRIWEDAQGVAAWVLIAPRYKGYDAQVRPDLRGGDFEREVITFADERTVELMRHHKIECDKLLGDSFRCDTTRSQVLVELGWVRDEDEPPYVLNRRSLDDIPEPVLPDSYSIRSARGPEEAAELVDVHIAAFTKATWTPELYRRYMTAPGYAAEREFVVVAPDGTFAAFALSWHDHVNRIGLLEPVGTHSEHRRLGLGKAVVLHAMHQMKASGMTSATVANGGTNEASRELYKACGFKPWHLIDDYYKAIPPQRKDGLESSRMPS